MLAAGDDSVNALSKTLVERAQNEVARIEPLVADGTLPKTALDEAKAKLADTEDQEILSETLYGGLKLENMTEAQAADMVAAAQRRVERQLRTVQQREKLLDAGIIARSDLQAFQDELQARERVLELAKSRVQLLHELAQMADAERRLERDLQGKAGSDLKNVMIRFGGNGLFSLSDLPTISTEFEKRFHAAMPVSARGQTLVHQAMGLDHRNRVDVALNPDSAEGVWLRQLLERLKIPYLAFRAAVAGAATAPHIHIGPESTRLRLASR
jgi:multidrug resistance efflux pump